MGLCVFSLHISLVMIVIIYIYILCLIIIIRLEVWTITHCLGLGHETMVCAVCLSVILKSVTVAFDFENRPQLCMYYCIINIAQRFPSNTTHGILIYLPLIWCWQLSFKRGYSYRGNVCIIAAIDLTRVKFGVCTYTMLYCKQSTNVRFLHILLAYMISWYVARHIWYSIAWHHVAWYPAQWYTEQCSTQVQFQHTIIYNMSGIKPHQTVENVQIVWDEIYLHTYIHTSM